MILWKWIIFFQSPLALMRGLCRILKHSQIRGLGVPCETKTITLKTTKSFHFNWVHIFFQEAGCENNYFFSSFLFFIVKYYISINEHITFNILYTTSLILYLGNFLQSIKKIHILIFSIIILFFIYFLQIYVCIYIHILFLYLEVRSFTFTFSFFFFCIWICNCPSII